ncbi:hypothetical protein HYT54_05110 [Candidatus Woesearchaeota archaeon]|nr:hypothetical protein [Candidatus Woesearchaeota archaeon]
MKNRKYICPICGYPDLGDSPLSKVEDNKRVHSYKEGAPTYVICRCCGTQFGYDDDELSWEELRKKWIKNGAKWFREDKKPKNWDLNKQLANLKRIKESDD